MAEENNTTDSEPTTANPAPTSDAPTQEPASPSSTTTTEDESTLLTSKSDEPKPGEPEADDPPNPLFGAPEGDYEITGLPEGVTVDTEALKAFEPIAKELGLSNDGMSKVAAAYTQILPQVEARVVEALQSDIAAQQASWANDTIEAVKTDPAFEGKALTDVQAVAAKALDRFGGPEFREFLTSTGLGNNPTMMKFAYLAGSAIAEDTTFERGGPAPAVTRREDLYYTKT